MIPRAPEGLPPPRGEIGAAPRVRLYLFQPCGEDPRLDADGAPGRNRATSNALPDRNEGPERPS